MSSLPTIAAVTAVAAAGTLAYSALAPQSQLFGPTLIAPDRPGEIALTYDDGPNPSATPQLLEVLARYNVRATFFLLGGYVRNQGALVREMAAAGHLIGNHSMTHPWLPFISNARILEELSGCNTVLEDTLGAPVRFFRPPHGARRPFVLKTARELGLTLVQWNIICGDWNPIAPETILARATRGIVRNQRDGRASNIVFHDGGQHTPTAPRLGTVEATRLLLEASKSTGRKFVTIESWA